MNYTSSIPFVQPSTQTIGHKQNSAKYAGQDAAKFSAQAFEAAFIAQMLQYSGLGDALTSSGGEDMQSFSQFYLEALAEKISENGGFGIAEKIYTHIKNKEGNHDELGRL